MLGTELAAGAALLVVLVLERRAGWNSEKPTPHPAEDAQLSLGLAKNPQHVRRALLGAHDAQGDRVLRGVDFVVLVHKSVHIMLHGRPTVVVTEQNAPWHQHLEEEADLQVRLVHLVGRVQEDEIWGVPNLVQPLRANRGCRMERQDVALRHRASERKLDIGHELIEHSHAPILDVDPTADTGI
eukprot:UN2102